MQFVRAVRHSHKAEKGFKEMRSTVLRAVDDRKLVGSGNAPSTRFAHNTKQSGLRGAEPKIRGNSSGLRLDSRHENSAYDYLT